MAETVKALGELKTPKLANVINRTGSYADYTVSFTKQLYRLRWSLPIVAKYLTTKQGGRINWQ